MIDTRSLEDEVAAKTETMKADGQAERANLSWLSEIQRIPMSECEMRRMPVDAMNEECPEKYAKTQPEKSGKESNKNSRR